jgi:hypothetical protein
MTEKFELKGKRVRSRWMRAILPRERLITRSWKNADMERIAAFSSTWDFAAMYVGK